ELHQVVDGEAVARARVDLGRRVWKGKIARGIELTREMGVQQIAAHMMANAVCQLLIRRYHLDDEPELMRGDRALGLERPHHAVAPVDVEADLEPVRGKIAQRLGPRFRKDLVDARDHGWAANAGDRDAAIA